jgi:uncharacterized protein YkwD
MRMRFWRVAIVSLIVLGAVAPGAEACSSTHVKLRSGNAAKVSRATVCLLNKQRARAGLKKLKANKRLRSAAISHSEDMVERSYFEHDGPSGDTLYSRAERVGYLRSDTSSWALAENIAYGSGGRGTAASIVRSWMGSSAHRDNILNSTVRDAGVGVASGVPVGGHGATFTLDLGYKK